MPIASIARRSSATPRSAINRSARSRPMKSSPGFRRQEAARRGATATAPRPATRWQLERLWPRSTRTSLRRAAARGHRLPAIQRRHRATRSHCEPPRAVPMLRHPPTGAEPGRSARQTRRAAAESRPAVRRARRPNSTMAPGAAGHPIRRLDRITIDQQARLAESSRRSPARNRCSSRRSAARRRRRQRSHPRQRHRPPGLPRRRRGISLASRQQGPRPGTIEMEKHTSRLWIDGPGQMTMPVRAGHGRPAVARRSRSISSGKARMAFQGNSSSFSGP